MKSPLKAIKEGQNMGIKSDKYYHVLNGLYGSYIDTDNWITHKYFSDYLNALCCRIFKTELNSLYGKSITYEKENKTMTNYQHLTSNENTLNEFKRDILKGDFIGLYKKYGIKQSNQLISADIFDWLIEDYIPPKTECIDLYKLIKFANNPALFNLDESAKITSELYKLDRYLYCKDVENDSYVVKRSNAFDVIISNTRQTRKSLIETEFDKLPKSTFNLSEQTYSGRYVRI